MTSLGKVNALRLLAVVGARRFDIQAVQPLQLSCDDRKVRIDQVQQGEIVRHNFLKEQYGLVANVALQLSIFPHGEQARVRMSALAQVARAKPLLDKTLYEVEGLRIAEHASDLPLEYFRILQLPALRQRV